jgi:hypothetical protein
MAYVHIADRATNQNYECAINMRHYYDRKLLLNALLNEHNKRVKILRSLRKRGSESHECRVSSSRITVTFS